MARRGLLRAVDAVTVPVPSLGEGLAFYADALGHELIWRNDAVGQVGLRLPGGPSELVLTIRQGYEPNWLVASVEDSLDTFHKLGCTVLAGPDDIPVGRVGVVVDPFGNRLVLLDLSKGTYPTHPQPAVPYASLDEQTRRLEVMAKLNPAVRTILERGPELDLPNWYLGGGAVSQTVWSALHGFDPQRGIHDYDLVYFDPDDLSPGAEQHVEERARHLFADLDVKIDAKNEARVHLWYHERFGHRIEPYQSTEHAISTWPTTAASVGVRDDRGHFVVCAPFGLMDLFAMIVRPNKTQVPPAVYEAKATRWASQWPRLTVIPW